MGAENPYKVLETAFLELLTPDGRKNMLTTDVQISRDGDEVFLMVGATDDDVLMQEAEEIGAQLCLVAWAVRVGWGLTVRGYRVHKARHRYRSAG